MLLIQRINYKNLVAVVIVTGKVKGKRLLREKSLHTSSFSNKHDDNKAYAHVMRRAAMFSIYVGNGQLAANQRSSRPTLLLRNTEASVS